MTAHRPPAPRKPTRVAVCVGDSITRGQVSANYVRLLERRWQPEGWSFVNAGVNGNLAYNVASRLDDVIERQPEVVTLLVGTNDVNAQFDDGWRARYRKEQRLPVDPTREWYAENVDRVLTRLRAETSATIAVLDIPPLGEDLGSRMNALVDEYNASLRGVAERHGVPCLPLHERLAGLLTPGRIPPAYEGNATLIITAAARHLLLRRSWDSVSRHNGLEILTDHIHLNDSAAVVVAELIGTVLGDDVG